jgi:hypothetical protein
VRKLRWPISLAIAFLLILVVAWTREKPDHLRDLAPFIESERTTYVTAKAFGLATAPTSSVPTAFSHRFIQLKQIDEKTLETILRASVARVKDFKDIEVAHDPFFFRGSAKNLPGLNHIQADASVSRGDWPSPPTTTYYVQEVLPMTRLEVLLLRVKMLGSDPFER